MVSELISETLFATDEFFDFVTGTLTVSCKIPSTADVSFDDVITNYDNYALKWYNVYEVARLLRSKFKIFPGNMNLFKIFFTII